MICKGFRLHTWSKWKTTKEFPLERGVAVEGKPIMHATIGQVIMQERQCECCDMRQVRSSTTRYG